MMFEMYEDVIGVGNTICLRCVIHESSYYAIFAVVDYIRSNDEIIVRKWSRYFSDKDWNVLDLDEADVNSSDCVVDGRFIQEVVLADEPFHLFDSELGIL